MAFWLLMLVVWAFLVAVLVGSFGFIGGFLAVVGTLAAAVIVEDA